MPGIAGIRGSTPVATTTSSKPSSASTVAPAAEPHVDAEHLEPAAVVAQRLGELLLAGDLHREPELPAELGVLLEQRHRVAALGERRRGAQAGRPGADDGDRRRGRGAVGGSSTSSVSRQARGLTRQEARLFSNAWSRQAWLQAMQVLISSARPARPC